MKSTSTKRQKRKKNTSFQPHLIALSMVAVMSSFALGIQTAGDVSSVDHISAEETKILGDMNLDGILTVDDAIILLEIAEGYTEPNSMQLLRDPNEDGQLTVSDAVQLLYTINSY